MRTLFTVVTLLASVVSVSPLFAATLDHKGMDHNGMDHNSMDHSAMHHGNMPSPATSTTTTVYQGTGVVKAWTDTTVTFAHQQIPALNWPAMTMRFGLSGYQGSPLSVGQSATFTFKQSASGYDLISTSAN